MIRSTTRLLMLTSAQMLMVASLAGAQDIAKCNPDTTKAVPISLVASGGIAKGAYQAGGLWAVLQRQRRLRDFGIVPADSLPKIATIAGASAGNVNTLLMALEWATPIKRTVG